MECMKRIKELPLNSYQVVNNSVDIEHACSDPTEGVDAEIEGAQFEPTENVDIKSAHPKPIVSVDTKSACREPIETTFTFVDSLSSQTVHGIRVKPKFRANHRTYKNPLDKARKKRFRNPIAQTEANQERWEMAQAFQPSNYQFTFTPMCHFNKNSQSMVASSLRLPGRSIDASLLPQHKYQPVNLNIFQQNLFNHGSAPSGSTSGPFVACGYLTINLNQQFLLSNPQLSYQESVVCNQLSS
ncbi:uncharacterized protein LOC131235059 [Magnolia sinica]|uniref:uncharacterized protein LOC131235059 n=1 Tax=Magnolia sinica TaxID=86752 RepID=UPI00265B5641|nr:uncharacterized protein LOC131235059 [Magnolia sinica]